MKTDPWDWHAPKAHYVRGIGPTLITEIIGCMMKQFLAHPAELLTFRRRGEQRDKNGNRYKDFSVITWSDD